MKKKIFAIALVGVMAIGLVGCGNRKEVTKNDPTTENAETTTIESETSDKETELETTEKEDNEIVTTEAPEEETTEEDIPVEYEVIQKDCYYIKGGFEFDTENIDTYEDLLSPGDVMPLQAENGDLYCTPDYIYTYIESKSDDYPNGWNVIVSTDSKNGEIREYIASEPVVYMIGTFALSETITESPIIPNTVKYMVGTFMGAEKLVSVPNLPKNLVDMSGAFAGCVALKEVPEIPNSVSEIAGTFYSSGLTKAPNIPSNVKNMFGTFGECIGLSGEIVFDANPDEYRGCFGGVDFVEQNITITGKTKLEPELRASRKNENYEEDMLTHIATKMDALMQAETE